MSRDYQAADPHTQNEQNVVFHIVNISSSPHMWGIVNNATTTHTYLVVEYLILTHLVISQD